MIDKPPLLDRDYTSDPNIKALKRKGFMNHGSPSSVRTCEASILFQSNLKDPQPTGHQSKVQDLGLRVL